jgi:hypothetical protein
MGRFAVGACAPNLFEQVCSDLIALQRSLLVLDTRDLGVLHLLRVELDELE